MSPTMPKREPRPGPAKRYPSREAVKSVWIPVDLWKILEKMGEAEERSVAYYVRKYVRECLEREGRLPKKHST